MKTFDERQQKGAKHVRTHRRTISGRRVPIDTPPTSAGDAFVLAIRNAWLPERGDDRYFGADSYYARSFPEQTVEVVVEPEGRGDRYARRARARGKASAARKQRRAGLRRLMERQRSQPRLSRRQTILARRRLVELGGGR